MTGNPLTRLQKHRNEASAGAWAVAQSHRQRLLELICRHKTGSQATLCILGAGNCNDLDLNALLNEFVQIQLVDIDLEALQRGCQSQSLTPSNQLKILGNCDLTGFWHQLAKASYSEAISDNLIDDLISAISEWSGPDNLGSFDTVVSTCMLSQVVEAIIGTIGSHDRCLEVIVAARKRHLQMLQDLTKPGGTSILVTDFVSTDTAPDLPTLSGQALADRLSGMIAEHNFFAGLNPMRITGLLLEPDFLNGPAEKVDCQLPWLWNQGSRYYAVTAISFQKSR